MKKYKCEICGEEFEKSYLKGSHIQSKHKRNFISKKGTVKEKKYTKICKICNSEFKAADVKASICPECYNPRLCKCGCNKILKTPGMFYHQGYKTKGKTYKEIYGTDTPKCGFRKGDENQAKKSEIKIKISEGVKKSYTVELRKLRSLQAKQSKNFLIYSKVSQELFLEVYKLSEEKENIYFGQLNKEFNVWCEEEKRLYSYDFVDSRKKKIIEYNGDLWHANPKYFRETDFPNPKDKSLSAKKIWEDEKRKIDFIESKGFKVLVVWDSDYLKDKQQVINECINFLNN